MEELFNELKKIRFNITKKMNSLLLETILMEQVLEQKHLTKIEYVLFYKHYEDIKEDYCKDFKLNNKEQIKKYNELIKKIEKK